jgi:hypothetical protein
MTEISSEIEIGAAAERVWEVLLDFGSYPDWNPYMTAISSKTHNRSQLKLETRLPGGRTVRSRAMVLTVEPERRLSWRTQHPIPGLPKREHTLELAPLAEDRLRVRHSVRLRGLLGRVLGWRSADLTEGLHLMNEALRRRSEAAVQDGPAARAA